MKIDIVHLPSEAVDFRDKTVIVLDILRATSTIVTALDNGCRHIIPVSAVREARDIHNADPAVLLCGERGGLKPEGFHLGNSPLEYRPDIVAGKSLVLTTSNGTRAILAGSEDGQILIGSFLNMQAVVEKALSYNRDIVILCSGNDGSFSFDDTLCAAMIIESVKRQHDNLQMNDAAQWSCFALGAVRQTETAANEQIIFTLMKKSFHGNKLLKLGFGKDIEYCSRLNSVNTVPRFYQGKLIF